MSVESDGMPQMPYISLKNVRKSYGETKILRGVNLNVLKAEVLGLVGPSGSGK